MAISIKSWAFAPYAQLEYGRAASARTKPTRGQSPSRSIMEGYRTCGDSIQVIRVPAGSDHSRTDLILPRTNQRDRSLPVRGRSVVVSFLCRTWTSRTCVPGISLLFFYPVWACVGVRCRHALGRAISRLAIGSSDSAECVRGRLRSIERPTSSMLRVAAGVALERYRLACPTLHEAQTRTR
jgi:hypothetical protein